MSKKLLVGSLAWEVTNEDLQQLFATIGEVEEATVVNDKFSGRSKGFGFVTYKNDADADKAIAELNGKDLKGRAIAVNEARPPKPRMSGQNRY